MNRMVVARCIGWGICALGFVGLNGCAPLSVAPPADPIARVKVIGFNDLHGHLEPPRIAIAAPGNGTATVPVPAGGAAHFATAVASLKAKNPAHLVVAAGDMIGATPLASALFLDEPTIEVLNAIGLDFLGVGNHEFDKGSAELVRMQQGGCAKHTLREPCQVSRPFTGARFQMLAANVMTAGGGTLFPATGMKTFRHGNAEVKVGVIGMTLKGTPQVVTPEGVKGLTFLDEAETANTHAARLREQGAAAVVVVVHEGGQTTGGYNDKSCPGLSGAIVAIMERLTPAVDVVVSGHTHQAYVCDYGRYNPARPFLLTSAGQYGTLLTEIDLQIDTRTRKVVAKSANNLIVQGEPFVNSAGRTVTLSPLYPTFDKDPKVAAIVENYTRAAQPLTRRVVGRISASVTRTPVASEETPMGNLIADAQLAATRAPERGGAQIALMNPGGVRADLVVPAGGGDVTYGQLFTVQPFGNSLVVKSMTGAQLKRLLEQQFATIRRRILLPSAGFSYSYDTRLPAGQRVSNLRLQGQPVQDNASYRVTMNSFLATGGDGFTVFGEGADALGGALDVDALEAYLAANPGLAPPATNRITRIDTP